MSALEIECYTFDGEDALTLLAPAQAEIERLTRERDDWERGAGFAVDKANEYASAADAANRRALSAEERVRVLSEALGLSRAMLAAGSDRSLIIGHMDDALAAHQSTEKTNG